MGMLRVMLASRASGLGPPLIVVAVAGCASTGTAPGRATGGVQPMAISGTTVETYTPDAVYEESVGARESEIWPHLAAVFDQLGVEVTEVKQPQWIMGNPRFRARSLDGQRLSRFVDCGRDFSGVYADQYEVTMTLMVQLLRGQGDGTNVNVLLTGSAQSRSTSGSSVRCTTNRTLEARLVQLIREKLGLGG